MADDLEDKLFLIIPVHGPTAVCLRIQHLFRVFIGETGKHPADFRAISMIDHDNTAGPLMNGHIIHTRLNTEPCIYDICLLKAH
jgi:hypothetical protein